MRNRVVLVLGEGPAERLGSSCGPNPREGDHGVYHAPVFVDNHCWAHLNVIKVAQELILQGVQKVLDGALNEGMPVGQATNHVGHGASLLHEHPLFST